MVGGADQNSVTERSAWNMGFSGPTGAEKGPVVFWIDTASESLLSLNTALTPKV